MADHLISKDKPECNSLPEKMEFTVKKENLFVEDGPCALEDNESYDTNLHIKNEPEDSLGFNNTKHNQIEESNIYKVGTKQEQANSNEDNRDSDQDFCLSKRRRKPKRGRKAAQMTGDPLQCPSCDYSSRKVANLKQHQLSHSTTKQLQCPQCDYKCHWKSWMERHNRTHEPSHDTPFSCDRCDYRTRWKSCIERHQLKHEMLKPFACDQCIYTATTKGDLRMHTMCHAATKRHKCVTCPYSTARRKSLAIHVKNYHTDGQPRSGLRVTPSGRRVSNESNIRIMTATGFRCPHCAYECGTKNHMRRHIGRHFDQTEFTCDHCSYKSHRKDYLKSHMLTHSKIKAFQCERCAFTCAWNSALRRHMLIHLDERPFQCNDCDFKSSDKSNLKRHVRSHLEIRLLLCSGCDEYFPAVENLVLHKKVSHKRDITGFLS